jgi:hypothetical protein
MLQKDTSISEDLVEDRGSKVLQNTEILQQHYTVSEPWRPQLGVYVLWFA